MNKLIISIIVILIIAAGIGAYFIFQKPALPQLQIGRCGDGICDTKEKANPNVCPKDCEKKPEETCKDLCGDGTCQEVVCMAIGCPCSETPESCPKDCQQAQPPTIAPPTQSSNINGVYVVAFEMASEETLNSLAANQYIDGFSIRTDWKTVEPIDNQYDWSKLDKFIEVASKNNKKAMLRIIAGASSPEWVYSLGAKKFEYVDQNPYHKTTYGKTLYMPIPWDEVYLSKWTEFVKEFGKRYNNEPSVTIIQMSGPAVGGEMHLVEKTNAERWHSVGYSNEVLLDAWKTTIDAFNSVFPNKQISLCIAYPVKFDDPQQFIEDVAAYGYQKAGTRFSIQGNFLAAKFQDDFPEYALIKDYSSKTSNGFQMLWSYTQDNGKRLGGSLQLRKDTADFSPQRNCDQINR